MPEFHMDGRTYEVDEEGFLQDPELWNEEVAKDFARADNVNEMTEEHLDAGPLHSLLLRAVRDGSHGAQTRTGNPLQPR